MRFQYNILYINSLEDKIESDICKKIETNLTFYQLTKQFQKNQNIYKLKKEQERKQIQKIQNMDLVQFMFRKYIF